MSIRATTYDRLTSEEISAWSTIQRAEPALASPYFRPEFTEAVAAVRDDVEVAILEESGEPVGFFPYERRKRNHGLPVGSFLSDMHGVIARSRIKYDPVELMRSCGLSTWSFHDLLVAQTPFSPFVYRRSDSPFIDLSNGFDVYLSTRRANFRRELGRTQRKMKRELGPMRFESDVRDPAVFATLIDWKVAQFKRTGVVDVLAARWVRDLLERILECGSEEFSGALSALYAGDTLLAVVYSLRSGNSAHFWFTCYDCEMSSFAPGRQLFMQAFSTGSSQGITRFGLGRGPEHFKKIIQTGATQVGEGAVDRAPLRARIRSSYWGLRNGIRSSPAHRILKRPAQLVSYFRAWRELN